MQLIHHSQVQAFASYQLPSDDILAQRAQLLAERGAGSRTRRGVAPSRWFDRRERDRYLNQLGVRHLVDRP